MNEDDWGLEEPGIREHVLEVPHVRLERPQERREARGARAIPSRA
jgi:hypothetical protein